MSRRKQKMVRIGAGLVSIDGPEYSADYKARLKAAGLDGELEPDASGRVDIDAQRLRIARRIDMFLNAWPGCPERICRRMRGCMAPGGVCSNVAPISDEERAAAWPQTMIKVRRALDEAIARHKAAGTWED